MPSGANLPFGCYQVLGNLRLKFGGASQPVQAYSRALDLSSAAATVAYRKDGVRFERTHFVSAADAVFVSRLSADQPGALSFTVALDRPERFETKAVSDRELLMTGTLNDGRGGKGVTYAGRLRVMASGGSVKADGDKLVIEKADEVLLLFAAATDFRGFGGRQLTDPAGATARDLDKAGEEIVRQTANRAASRSREVVPARRLDAAGDRE